METHVTSGDVLANISGHLGPPIVARDQLQHFPSSTMSWNFGIVTKRDNLLTDICQIQNVDFAMKM